MANAQLLAVSSVLGKERVSTCELLEKAGFQELGYPTNFIENELKISHVRRSELSVLPSDLAIGAAQKALEDFPGSVHDIDAVIFCGIERDCTEPSTAHRINKALGTKASLVFDITDACHGFTQGMNVARNFIENGTINFALIVTGERSSIRSEQVSRYFNEGKLGASDIKDKIGAFTLGDAGGAMILGPCHEETGIIDMTTVTDSRWGDLCKFQNFGAELGVEPEYGMSMQKICAITIKMVKDHRQQVMDKVGWDSIDWFVPHQVGELPFLKYLEIFELPPEKSIATYPQLGNLASATIPVALAKLDSEGKLKTGDKILAISSGSGVAVTFVSMIY